MQYFKGYAFIKRTCLLLSPLFLVTLASKELAFYSPAATLSPIFGGLSEDINSIRKLESELGINTPIDGIESYGDLMIQKTSYGEETWIEQENPLGGLKYGQEFKYEELNLNNPQEKKIKITKVGEENPVYRIDKDSFEASDLKDKGSLSLLTVFDLTLNDPIQTIPITHVAPLSDLINAPEKQYSVVKVEEKESWLSRPLEDEYLITLKKDENQNSFSISLSKNPKFSPSSSALRGDLSTLAIKSFYILYNEEPPLNPERFFSTGEADAPIIGDVSSNPRAKKVFLSRWSNKKSKNSKDPQYDFKIGNDFWKSNCEDPYKVGGFIDKKLEGTPALNQQKLEEKVTESPTEALKYQKNAYVDFRSDVTQKPPHEKQYYWKQFDQNEQWVPSDENSESGNYECKDLDEETEKKFKEYLSSNKSFWRESIDNRQIKKSIIPDALKTKLGILDDNKHSQVKENENQKYPQNKIVQSSFRAWGNAYNTKEISGPKIKEAGIYSSSFERAVKKEHKFEISIDKQTWINQLIKNPKFDSSAFGKKLNENPDVSSVIEVNYPISFEFYDPISNYLRKHKLLLKTELDLRNLYLQSHFSKEVFRFDIGRENKKIGEDYQGFDPIRRNDKKKEYGLDGIFSLIAGLELDIEKNLKISLTAQTSGFVNTKNPSCDLRHRLYKIDTDYATKKNLDQKWSCSEDKDWKYRDYIHIPSYLVLSLDREPEVSSFYVDNNSDLEFKESTKKKVDEEIKNLKDFESNLETKKITKVIHTNETNNGEIYFEDIAAYNFNANKEFGKKLHLPKGWLLPSYHQYIYYYTPRRQINKIPLENEDKLKFVKFYLSGSRHSHSSFFHSGHFNTIKTLCKSDKYIPQKAQKDKQCADGIDYEEIETDKKYSDLKKYDGDQTIEVNWSDIKSSSSSSSPLEVNFRTVLNRGNIDGSSNDFKNTKTKLEHLFKEDTKDPESEKTPTFSLLCVWYSLVLEWKENKLHYTTKLRPISMVSEKISNSTTHKTSGAAGSAGFEITKIELHY